MVVAHDVEWIFTVLLFVIVLITTHIIMKAHHFSGVPVVLIVLFLLVLRILLNWWITSTYYEYDRGIGVTTGLTFFSWFIALPLELGHYVWLAGYPSKYQGHH